MDKNYDFSPNRFALEVKKLYVQKKKEQKLKPKNGDKKEKKNLFLECIDIVYAKYESFPEFQNTFLTKSNFKSDISIIFWNWRKNRQPEKEIFSSDAKRIYYENKNKLDLLCREDW